MPQEQKKSRMPQIGEAVFCIACLIFDLIAALRIVLCLFPQNN